MFKVIVGYNTEDEEYEIAQKVANDTFEPIQTVLSFEDLQQIKKEVKAVHIEDELSAYIVRLVFATRDPKKYAIEELEQYIAFGASPRATIDMLKAVKARAYLRGHDFVSPIDIALTIKDVLRHRIILSYDAIAEGLSSDDIVQKILESIEVP
jgi:MoxR-like ATPase